MAGDFFEGVEQLDVRAGGYEVRLPIFYRESRGLACVFPVSWVRARRLLPDRRLVPAQVLPGVGAIQVGVFEHRDTDVGPYNELFLAPVLNSPSYLPLPGYNMLRQLLRMEYYTYLYHVPVSTDIALRKTETFYGCPTSLASIDFSEEGGRVTCVVEQEGELVLRLAGRILPAGRTRVMKDFIHSYQQKQPQRAEVKANLVDYALSFNPSNAELSLGSKHPLAADMNGLLLSERPLMYLYSPRMQLILYGPESPPLALLRGASKDV